ncbi:MAG: tetratricopeptide repeat protein [Gammaproteobacteria bacterium]|nr:tetratricopeptide repeat protein [Gammaproteobacteria bacterium]
MVDVNLSEEEQVEALKKWWKENGRSLIVGVVMGLGAVFGWQAWNQHQKSIADQASTRYEQLSQAVSEGATESAAKQAESLIEDYEGTAYATFAALELGRIRLEQGDVPGAEAQLGWVLDNSDDRSFQQIARLRLARLLFSLDRLDEAEGLLDQSKKDSFQGEISELRGDIAWKRGDFNGARESYQEALAIGSGSASLVQMKLDDLPPVL